MDLDSNHAGHLGQNLTYGFSRRPVTEAYYGHSPLVWTHFDGSKDTPDFSKRKKNSPRLDRDTYQGENVHYVPSRSHICILAIAATLRRRRELRIFAVLLPAVLSLRLVLPPAMSREDSLAAAKLWSSGLYPVVPLSGDFVQAFQLCMEHRSQLMNSTSSSSERRESHQPPCAAPLHLNGARSCSITSPDPSLIGKIPISPSCKVMLYSPPGCLRDGGSFPLRRSSSGGHSVGIEEHLRSKASRLVRTTFTELMSFNYWAWPICLMKLVSLPRPSPIKENSIQISMVFHAWVNVSKILGGISPCYIFSYLSNWMNLLVKSPVSILFQSTSSEEKVSPYHALFLWKEVSPRTRFRASVSVLSSVCYLVERSLRDLKMQSKLPW
ncbi:hypothetical protein F2Q70_00045002 [Brassica cretica]|uniref:Uncharacterized protein n=1 Tax=Brassica cretica TaxID=69181 RepID=A0A8S9KCX0_BRACR|nr:hypothetical protein F2Q70_00045002 [Brassica cretica]